MQSPTRRRRSAQPSPAAKPTASAPRLAFMTGEHSDAGLTPPPAIVYGMPRSSSHDDIARVTTAHYEPVSQDGAGSLEAPIHLRETQQPSSAMLHPTHTPSHSQGGSPVYEAPRLRRPASHQLLPPSQSQSRSTNPGGSSSTVSSQPAGRMSARTSTSSSMMSTGSMDASSSSLPASSRPTSASGASVLSTGPRPASAAAAAPRQGERPPQMRTAPSRPSSSGSGGSSQAPSVSTLPSIRVTLPDVESLQKQREHAVTHGTDLDRLRWSVQVLKLVERMQTSQAPIEDPVPGWIEEAITQIVQSASHLQPEPEALYARGDLLASGAFPQYVAKDLRSAFSDFERSARMGWAPSWFRIGRDYETLGDFARARTAYTRGIQVNDVGSMYRMSMAKLLGQLEVSQDTMEGVALLQASADAATVDTPHPAYIYALLLAGELSSVPVPLEAFITPDMPSPTRASLAPLAKRYLERAAYLNLAAAQSKCGWCYEHAQLSFPFDPLMSVQYYSAASQGGDPESDMALSKWFLCGAEGCFEKNESLAWTFAERAAKHHVPTAEFAMGYYLEVGIGVPINLEQARVWYTQAAEHGNEDAKERLQALSASASGPLSRADHQEHLDERVYAVHQRARTASGGTNPVPSPTMAASGGDLARRRTLRMAEDSAQRRQAPTTSSPKPTRPSQGPALPATAVSYLHNNKPGTTSTKKGPQTFSEMGYTPKPDKECTIC
ncbi:hcp-like protein [Malassezia pachydermatis]|uniref:Hcp-like protein n=1 Tax=Malassezia pachydermatis TaxID=77020 RepID=A0A0M8MNH0_9BASI|nr:hcp-like protein [Malassezia pachydermatis]KOS16046.1 hcp-like protein [Malassezia pachydermatis]